MTWRAFSSPFLLYFTFRSPSQFTSNTHILLLIIKMFMYGLAKLVIGCYQCCVSSNDKCNYPRLGIQRSCDYYLNIMLRHIGSLCRGVSRPLVSLSTCACSLVDIQGHVRLMCISYILLCRLPILHNSLVYEFLLVLFWEVGPDLYQPEQIEVYMLVLNSACFLFEIPFWHQP